MPCHNHGSGSIHLLERAERSVSWVGSRFSGPYFVLGFSDFGYSMVVDSGACLP